MRTQDNNDRVWDVINTWGPFLLGLIPTGTITAGIVFNSHLVWIIGLVLLVLFVIFMLFLFNPVKARIYQWKYGCIKGLWKDNSLNNQIYKCFTNSNFIRIKVTRGTELVKENNNINILDELTKLKEEANEQNPKNMQILLMSPCLKLKHVRERYITHEGEYTSEQEFLDSWKKTLEELVKYETPYFKISIRFYSGGHSRWRFYICSQRSDEKQIILLSNYDRDTPGSTTPMYKIIKGEKNIGAFMDKYFNDIWDTSIKLKDYVNYVRDKRCMRLFCEECKHTDINQGEYCKEDYCKVAKCDNYDKCLDRIEKWEEFYDNLSRLQRVNLDS